MRSFFSRIHWKQFSAFPWHALFMALYAPLGLGAHNIGQTSLGSIVRAVTLSGILAILLLLVCWLFLRNWRAAGIVTTILMVLFLTYGHLYNFLNDLEVGGFLIGRHRYLVIVWAGLAVAGSWWAIRKSRNILH
jgi:hypothetical protein